jgi:hypothetical protein
LPLAESLHVQLCDLSATLTGERSDWLRTIQESLSLAGIPCAFLLLAGSPEFPLQEEEGHGYGMQQ